MTTGILEKVFLRGTITALTGLRVGGTDQGLSVGGLQNIVIRHALLNEPYIPGSSLRGKMRCSLERLQGRSGRGHGDMITFGPCDDPRLTTVQLFGTESADLSAGEAANAGAGKKPDDEKEAQRTAVIPSRLLVRDALLTGKSRNQLKPLRGDLPMTETKTEVCIDRVTSAANPRTFERVPAGAVFAFEMVLEVRALPGPIGTGDARDKVLAILAKDRNEGNHWGRDEDLRWLLTGLDLLQDDALGGQGSRGYGRVKITLDPPKRRTRDDYQKGRDESEWALQGELKQHFDALNKRGEDERKQIAASLPRSRGVSAARAFDLAFHAPLRVGGNARDNADAARDYPSDTLSAALVVAAADLFGDTVQGRSIADLARDPPWVVSSLLPWAELGRTPVRFFPRPADHQPERRDDTSTKTYRRVAYLSADLLARPALPWRLSACHTLAAGSDEIRDLTWQRRAVRPSVTLDRVTSASNLFHLEEVAIATVRRGEHAKAGAWLAVRTEEETHMDLVRALLRHLADSGIGADRTRGMGHFSVLRDQPLQLAEAAQRRVLLGYASPDEGLAKALGDEEARYTVVRRGGHAHGAQGGLGLPRRSLRLVTPGAVLPNAGAVVGRTRDVTPPGFGDHPIFRDGRTLAWPLGGSP